MLAGILASSHLATLLAARWAENTKIARAVSRIAEAKVLLGRRREALPWLMVSPSY